MLRYPDSWVFFYRENPNPKWMIWEYPHLWETMENQINQWEFQDPKMEVPTI